MIELKNNSLIFSFKNVHPDAGLSIQFQRTPRVPDDNRDYFLPPGLGPFPLELVDDFEKNLPPVWIEHGGIFMPMYQSEAMWINFHSLYSDDRYTSYPFAIKIAAGKINAVTGESWNNELNKSPQDYLVSPTAMVGWVLRKKRNHSSICCNAAWHWLYRRRANDRFR